MCESELKIDIHGTRRWYQYGKLHRIDGPAVEYANGTRKWYQNGKLHRTDGPAEEWSSGIRCWYQNDKLHRTDGPAVEYADGSTEYWIQGVEVNETIVRFIENGLLTLEEAINAHV